MSNNIITKINQFIEKYYNSQRINFQAQYEMMKDMIFIQIKYNDTRLVWFVDYDLKELETSSFIKNNLHGQIVHSHDGEHQQHFYWDMKLLH